LQDYIAENFLLSALAATPTEQLNCAIHVIMLLFHSLTTSNFVFPYASINYIFPMVPVLNNVNSARFSGHQ